MFGPMNIPTMDGIVKKVPKIYQGILLPILVLIESLKIPTMGVVSPSVTWALITLSPPTIGSRPRTF